LSKEKKKKRKKKGRGDVGVVGYLFPSRSLPSPPSAEKGRIKPTPHVREDSLLSLTASSPKKEEEGMDLCSWVGPSLALKILSA